MTQCSFLVTKERKDNVQYGIGSGINLIQSYEIMNEII